MPLGFHLVKHQDNIMACSEKMLYAFAVAFFSYNLSEVRIIGEGEILGALSFRLMKYHLQCSLFTPHFSMIIKF